MALAQLARRGAGRLAPAARALWQADQCRAFAAEPAKGKDDEDLVLSSFRRSQQQYAALMAGLQSIPAPLDGGAAAAAKYAADVEALKAKLGVPDVEAAIEAELDHKYAVAGGDVRRFVADATAGLDLGAGLAGVVPALLAAVDAAEASSGAPLGAGNDKGWAALSAALAGIEKDYGLGDRARVRSEAVAEMYAAHLGALRAAVEDDVAKGARADASLEGARADLGKLRPNLVGAAPAR